MISLLDLFSHFALLSLLAIGGAITTAPDMHRYLVDEKAWLDEMQFTSSISIAQAAPGPNLLFVTLLGWNTAGWQGALVTTLATLLPSTTLALLIYRWSAKHHAHPLVLAIRKGLPPLTIGLLLSIGWILSSRLASHWVFPALTLLTMGVLQGFKKLNPLWMIALGGVAGAASGFSGV